MCSLVVTTLVGCKPFNLSFPNSFSGPRIARELAVRTVLLHGQVLRGFFFTVPPFSSLVLTFTFQGSQDYIDLPAPAPVRDSSFRPRDPFSFFRASSVRPVLSGTSRIPCRCKFFPASAVVFLLLTLSLQRLVAWRTAFFRSPRLWSLEGPVTLTIMSHCCSP